MTSPAEPINDTPQSLEEWKQYVAGMTGPQLLEQALAANTPGFVRILLDEEGYEASEITAVLRMFAEALDAEGQTVPSRSEGAYLDLASLLDTADLDVVEVA